MSQDPRTRQQSTSHILKTGKRGNPFVKDTHDLFSTLVASLQLTTNTRFFRSYPNSFTTDDAAANLSSLRFSQSNRSTDPNDPSRIVTTTTTTTFSMNRDIAKGICQHFMDARLIENAADPLNPIFKERGIYQITPKGLHVLERFITKNGIHADHLVRVFTTQPICMKLLHLERRPTDDEIHITPNVINVVFKRFSGGRNPNYVCDPNETNRNPTTVRPFTENPRLTPNYDRSLGVELQDVREKASSGTTLLVKHVFSSTSAIDWLVDFSTCCGREEAAELLAHFVRYGLITLHIDRSKGADKVAQVLIRAPSTEQTIPGVFLEGQFKYGAKVTYRITDEGRRLSGVDRSQQQQPRISEDDPHSANDQGVSIPGQQDSLNDGRQVLRDILHADSNDGAAWVRDATSSSARLKAILGEPALRSLFRDFLRSHICEENLHYWIDVQEFRRRFATSSTAVGVGSLTTPSNHLQPNSSSSSANPKKKIPSSATTAMEQHQEKLVSTALLIFNTYLAPGSPSELNIDHNLRADVISYMSKAVDEAQGTPNSPDPSEGSVPALRATQVQALLRHYERIADHIYRLMATDQVPKFVRTERFLEILSAQQLDESRDSEGTTMTSGYGSDIAATASASASAIITKSKMIGGGLITPSTSSTSTIPTGATSINTVLNNDQLILSGLTTTSPQLPLNPVRKSSPAIKHTSSYKKLSTKHSSSHPINNNNLGISTSSSSSSDPHYSKHPSPPPHPHSHAPISTDPITSSSTSSSLSTTTAPNPIRSHHHSSHIGTENNRTHNHTLNTSSGFNSSSSPTSSSSIHHHHLTTSPKSPSSNHSKNLINLLPSSTTPVTNQVTDHPPPSADPSSSSSSSSIAGNAGNGNNGPGNLFAGLTGNLVAKISDIKLNHHLSSSSSPPPPPS
ncbi:hypothetical protein MJO28_002061 [Puccinia striiformis f. sp. tritici]|uniref:RGS domain-containing protein n=2 Tax=Puccinia striiformis f. sp. tritici TaxID=168172 RepID=A0A0L0VFV8_9BASI|nr:hypothetical protein MJO28_002061 [Puccinia striiformis f. sp. tritici]KAI9618095.1 hypothetical protein H4Q26_012438 [Puccinia striiformis f. sp. tritici PST-130]KNE97884.1 hypothetical protein PSTG_08907 [Puccinia striiformis f. sp. tritici PST-78]